MTTSSRRPSKRIGTAKGVKVPDDIYTFNVLIAEWFIKKGESKRKARAIAREMSTAIKSGVKQALSEPDSPVAPRHIVDMMTMSSVELGRGFKQVLQDQLWDAKHQKRLSSVKPQVRRTRG
jgi:hypothetical protein